MNKQKNQGSTGSNPGAALRKAQARYAAQCRRFRRSIVALVRSWIRSGVVASLNQVAVELNRRAVPQLQGSKGWQRKIVVAVLRQEAPNLLAKLDRPRQHYLTAPELARKLGVNNKQIYYAVARGTLGCRRFGRKIVFHPDVVERAARALREHEAKSR
jgi:hypothetical protein